MQFIVELMDRLSTFQKMTEHTLTPHLDSTFFYFCRCFAPDALRWDLWIRCSLLAAWQNCRLCGQRSNGAGTRGLGPGGESWAGSQAS